MAVDFDAIRRKLAQISGKNKKKESTWKPAKDTTHIVRLLPFPDNEGQPFKERHFYYNIGNNPGLLAPFQFNEPDPFQELITKLRSDGSKESYELCKKLYPKMRTFAAIIVRGEEDKGVQIWTFGKQVYQSILNIMLDEDYGDITDPVKGIDLKVTVTQPDGAQYAKTEIMPKPKASALSSDAAQARAWMSSIPNIDDLHEKRSYAELEKIINSWLASGSSEEETAVNVDEPTTGVEKQGKISKKEKKADAPDKVHNDLDAAFADIMSDD